MMVVEEEKAAAARKEAPCKAFSPFSPQHVGFIHQGREREGKEGETAMIEKESRLLAES